MAATHRWNNTVPDRLLAELEEAEVIDLGPFWSELAQYRLLGTLNANFVSLNQRAGGPMLRERTVIQAKEKKAVCKYNYENSEFEFEMAITLRMCGVTVQFSKRRQGRRGAWLKHHVLDSRGGQSYDWALEHSLEFPKSTVRNNDVKMWFIYLISGFRDSCKPATPRIELPMAS